jgi:hypothetical protein
MYFEYTRRILQRYVISINILSFMDVLGAEEGVFRGTQMKNNPNITDIIKTIRQTILKPILMLLLSMSCFIILILEEGVKGNSEELKPKD